MGYKVLYHSVALFLCLMKGLHVKAQCSKPRFEGDVVLSDQYISTNSFTEGDQVTFECIPGYKPVDLRASRSVTCRGKQWTNLSLTCTRKSCASPPEFLHGSYEITSGILFGDTIRAVCDIGYELYGSVERTCRAEGMWDGRDPECEAVKCTSPPVIENGQIEGGHDINMEYVFGEVVTYKCNTGFSLDGSADVVCLENGNFNPEPPKCVDGCVKPNVPHAVRIAGRSPPYKLGSILEYKCESGYEMKGEGYIVCKGHGWDPKPPQCIGLSCGLPVFQQRGVVSQQTESKTFPEGSRVTFECLSGYKPLDPKASNVITCADGKWTPLQLTCKDEKDSNTVPGETTSHTVPAVASVVTLLGIIAIIAAAVFIKRKKSKHEYSDKVETNEEL